MPSLAGNARGSILICRLRDQIAVALAGRNIDLGMVPRAIRRRRLERRVVLFEQPAKGGERMLYYFAFGIVFYCTMAAINRRLFYGAPMLAVVFGVVSGICFWPVVLGILLFRRYPRRH
jgi:hypothetical protein